MALGAAWQWQVGTGTWSEMCLEEVMAEPTVLEIRGRRERALQGEQDRLSNSLGVCSSKSEKGRSGQGQAGY